MEPVSRVFLSDTQERLLKWLSVGLISVIAFEALAVATVMPTVVRELNGTHLYALAMGVVMATQLMTTALAGAWSDSAGPTSCLYSGIALFGAGLIVCTVSPSMEAFVIGRAIQGLGGGLCVVPLYTLIGHHVRPAHQPQFFAAFAAAWVLPALIGPAIAGLIVSHTSWRVVFGMVPALLLVALPILFITLRQLPRKPPVAAPAGVHRTVILACIAGAAIAVLQIASGTEPGAFTPLTIAAIACGCLIVALSVRPLLPPGTLSARRGLGSTVLVRGITNGTFIGVETFLPLLLQDVHHWSVTEAGLVLTVGSITWALGSGLAGRITRASIRERIPWTGAILQMVGFIVTILGSFATVSGSVVVLGWFVTGFGIGLIYPTMTVHALAMTPVARQGATSSALQLADTVGAAFCVAAAGLAYAAVMPAIPDAFVAALALMGAVMAIGVAVSRRVAPTPGSEQALLIASTRASDDEE